MSDLTIRLQTVTPLWTGGIGSNCDRVHETGIIGSLRWWYEVIVRGLGGKACDPSDRKCKLDEKKFKRPASQEPADWRFALLEAEVCDACQAYGATGWSRRYRLRLGGGENLSFKGALNVRPGHHRRGWFLGAGLCGTISGDVVPRSLFAPGSIVVPLALAERVGGLGSRTQHGYGVVRGAVLENGKPIQVTPAMLQSLPSGGQVSDEGMPSLRNMFFALVTFRATGTDWWQSADGLDRLDYRDENKLAAWLQTDSVPVSPVIRHHIRFEDGLGLQDEGQVHFVFGSSDRICRCCYQRVTVRGEVYDCPLCRRVHKSETLERAKTKVHISAAYPVDEAQGLWQVRVWGWLPRGLPPRLTLDRETVLEHLHRVVSDAAMWRAALGNRMALTGVEWREFSSARDSKTPEETDMLRFLESLVIGEGER